MRCDDGYSPTDDAHGDVGHRGEGPVRIRQSDIHKAGRRSYNRTRCRNSDDLSDVLGIVHNSPDGGQGSLEGVECHGVRVGPARQHSSRKPKSKVGGQREVRGLYGRRRNEDGYGVEVKQSCADLNAGSVVGSSFAERGLGNQNDHLVCVRSPASWCVRGCHYGSELASQGLGSALNIHSGSQV